MAVRDAFFPGKLAHVAQNVGLSTWKGFTGNLPDLGPHLVYFPFFFSALVLFTSLLNYVYPVGLCTRPWKYCGEQGKQALLPQNPLSSRKDEHHTG